MTYNRSNYGVLHEVSPLVFEVRGFCAERYPCWGERHYEDHQPGSPDLHLPL